jgi:hypothetical protein
MSIAQISIAQMSIAPLVATQKIHKSLKLLSFYRSANLQFSDTTIVLTTGLQIRNANSHDCEKVRSEANSLRFASHKIDLTSLRFRFAIFKMRSLSLRFRNLNRLRIRRAKSAKISLFLGSFFLFFPAQSN